MLTLFAHQKKATDIIRKSPRWYWNADPGIGKTIGTYAMYDAAPMKTLVLAPLSTLRTAWAADAALFPSIRVKIIRSDKAAARRAAIAAANWDVAVTNYDTFRAHAGDFAAAGVRRLVIDEAVKVKNKDAKLTRAAIAFADKCESVIALSGLAAPNDGTEWWAQMRCVDVRCFGPSFWAFVNKYFVVQKRRIKGRDVVAGYTQTPEQLDAFSARLSKWVWRLKKSECLDLPPQLDMIRSVELSPEERAVYAAVEDDLRIAVDSGEDAKVRPEAVLTKLRQITGGSVRVDGEAVQVGGAKLAALGEIIDDELGAATPLVVWCEFRAEIDRVAAMLGGRGGVGVIDGRTSDKAAQTVADFEAGRLQYVVAHPAAAGHGTNGLQRRCSNAVFYSLSFSLDQHVQARDRIHRAGMLGEPAVYWYLIAEGTVDETALWALRRKGKASELVLRALGRGVAEMAAP